MYWIKSVNEKNTTIINLENISAIDRSDISIYFHFQEEDAIRWAYSSNDEKLLEEDWKQIEKVF